MANALKKFNIGIIAGLDMNDFNILDNILNPFSVSERKRIVSDNVKLVHYTSSENAVNIIKNKCLWMRNTSCMNDYSEVGHGYRVVHDFFAKKKDSNGSHNFGFHKDLESLVNSALDLFDQAWSGSKNNIYIASLSEHLDKEDRLGRLSMWRAYGGGTDSAALILNNPQPTDGLNVFLYPACYSDHDATTRLESLLNDLKINQEFLLKYDKDLLRNNIVLTLVSIIVSLKHSGFEEEKEWRIVYMPTLLSSEHEMKNTVEVIGGVPQIVYKLPFDGGKIPNLNITNLIDKILIGPSSFPSVQHQAFWELLSNIGIDPGGRINLSHIPLRG
jgi:hypothetical protein